MSARAATITVSRVRACLSRARVLRPDRALSACSGRGVFSVIGDVLGGIALFVVLFGVAILS